MKLPRRKFLRQAAGAATLPALSRSSRARSYPAKPVRVVADGITTFVQRLGN
jgi:hypothetical protein